MEQGNRAVITDEVDTDVGNNNEKGNSDGNGATNKNGKDSRAGGSLADELLKTLPANLFQIEGGLFFCGGQTFFFYQDERGEHHFKCLSSESLRIAFTLENIDSGWVPPGIVRCGTNTQGQWFVKFVPPQKHSLVISDDAGNKTTLVRVPLPGLIFGGCGSKYYVWATTEAEFNPLALCYHAPLSNLYDDGRVCYGNNQVQAASNKMAGPAWWLFMNSPFNNHLSQNKSARYPSDVRRQLLEMHKSQSEVYPIEDLRHLRPSRDYTIEDAVERYILGQTEF